jgi:hypothetical protein
MISVGELMSDPDFSDSYTVIRTKAGWDGGRLRILSVDKLRFHGPVQPASPKELEQLPEGDRQKDIMKFFCRPPSRIRVTMDAQSGGEGESVSDMIEFRGMLYKVLQVADWSLNGFFRAFGSCVGESGNG